MLMLLFFYALLLCYGTLKLCTLYALTMHSLCTLYALLALDYRVQMPSALALRPRC